MKLVLVFSLAMEPDPVSHQSTTENWGCCGGPGLEPTACQPLLTFIFAFLVPPVSTLSHPTPGMLGSGQSEMAAAPLWCLVGIIGKAGFETREVFQVSGERAQEAVETVRQLN